MRMVSRRTERCSRDGRRVVHPGGSGENETVERGTEGPCWARIDAGVESCETCTLSYAGCWGDDDAEGSDAEGVQYCMSVPRYRDEDADEDEDEDGPAASAFSACACCCAAVRTSALRSTPSTTFKPDGWEACTTRNSCSMSERAL